MIMERRTLDGDKMPKVRFLQKADKGWKHRQNCLQMPEREGRIMRGDKFNKGKPRMSLLPGAALKAVAMVYNYGEQKYDTHNWAKGIPFSELIDATERHINDFKEGENLDKESNLHHLAHAVFGLMCILWFMYRNRRDLDDRLVKDNKGWGRRSFFSKMKEPPMKLKEGYSNDSN
jgi:hypothetical protein